MAQENEQNLIVIGASHAAVSLASNLRKLGWQGSIALFSKESYLPYHRPPLSKDFLQGSKSLQSLQLKQADYFQANNIQLHLDCSVTLINPSSIKGNTQGSIEYFSSKIGEHSQMAFDKLVFATGAEPRILPNTDRHQRMCYVRNIDDIQQIKTNLKPDSNVVLIGGGYIGLEIAASLRQLNHNITVLESMPRLLARVAAEPISDYFAALHIKHGVNIQTSCQITSIDHKADVSTIELANGDCFNADLIVVGIGVIPNTQLAESIGAEVNNGIRVDDNLQTNLANIYAIGDCANFFHPLYDEYIRLESVPNCNCHAKRLAENLTGQPNTAPEQPWFWSDQYDVKLQITGLSLNYDNTVVKQGADEDSLVVGYMKQGQLIALDCLNMPKTFVWGKKNLSQPNGTQDYLQMAIK